MSQGEAYFYYWITCYLIMVALLILFQSDYCGAWSSLLFILPVG